MKKQVTSARTSARALTRRATTAFATQVKVLGGTLAVFWAALGVNAMLGGALTSLGIIPRTEVGLRGIIFGPFLHANVDHLASNSVPFVVLGWLIMVRNARQFIPVTLITMLTSGLFAWLFGAPGSVTIGASGVIFGYLGFLMLSGWFDRRIWGIVLSVAVTAMWGGVVYGVLPGQPGVSWQGHLGGFLGGILAARLLRSK